MMLLPPPMMVCHRPAERTSIASATTLHPNRMIGSLLDGLSRRSRPLDETPTDPSFRGSVATRLSGAATLGSTAAATAPTIWAHRPSYCLHASPSLLSVMEIFYDIRGGGLRPPPAPAAGGRKRPSSPARAAARAYSLQLVRQPQSRRIPATWPVAGAGRHYVSWSSSATSSRTRRAMSSRVARTSSIGRPCGILELPVDVALARDVGALVAASHRDHDVGLLGQLARQLPWDAVCEVDAELAHHLHDLRVHVVGRRRAGRERAMPAGGGALEQRGAHLRAPRVLPTHEQCRRHQRTRTAPARAIMPSSAGACARG